MTFKPLVDYRPFHTESSKIVQRPHVKRINCNYPECLRGSSDLQGSVASSIARLNRSWFLFVRFKEQVFVTNHTRLTHWKRILQPETGKWTRRHRDALLTTCNAAFRRAWRRRVITSAGEVMEIFSAWMKAGVLPTLSQFCHPCMIYSWIFWLLIILVTLY